MQFKTLTAAKVLLSILSSFSIAAERPNILFIFSDDHAEAAISAYGSHLAKAAPTPNLDRIASEGAIFHNSFCANSICGPSRACILTGLHSHSNGFLDNNNSRFDGSQIIATRHKNGFGVPALFPGNLFDSLKGLTGPSGARNILNGSGHDVVGIDLPNARFDIDTQDDLRTVLKQPA